MVEEPRWEETAPAPTALTRLLILPLFRLRSTLPAFSKTPWKLGPPHVTVARDEMTRSCLGMTTTDAPPEGLTLTPLRFTVRLET